MNNPDPAIPARAERAELNAALLAEGTETGFWDDDGRSAPWPDDIEHWQPETGPPITRRPGEPPFYRHNSKIRTRQNAGHQ